jgi:hypothetical protein
MKIGRKPGEIGEGSVVREPPGGGDHEPFEIRRDSRQRVQRHEVLLGERFKSVSRRRQWGRGSPPVLE